MRLLKIMIFMVSFCHVLLGQHPKTTWYKEYFNGDVKLCTETEYHAKDYFGEIISTTRAKGFSGPYDIQRKFNRNGYVTRRIQYFGGQRECHRELYEYSEDKIEITVYNCDSVINEKLIYILDPNNVIKKYLYYDSLGTNTYFETYKYSINGDTIFERGYSPKTDQEGIPRFKTFKYDQHSNIIEQRLYEFGDLFLHKTYGYNGKNKLVRQENYTYVSENELISHTEIIFDGKGNILEKIIYDIRPHSRKVIDKKYTYTYQFDHQGNWIKKVQYEDQVPKYITERCLFYYE